MLAYGEEGPALPGSRLVAVNNTFVSDRPAGGTAIAVDRRVTAPAVVANTIATGLTTLVTQPQARLLGNCLAADPRFTDRKAYDYRLRASSPCRDRASRRPPGGLPHQQYRYNLTTARRAIHGKAPDAGALER
jgi:hypothetical protein